MTAPNIHPFQLVFARRLLIVYHPRKNKRDFSLNIFVTVKDVNLCQKIANPRKERERERKKIERLIENTISPTRLLTFRSNAQLINQDVLFLCFNERLLYTKSRERETRNIFKTDVVNYEYLSSNKFLSSIKSFPRFHHLKVRRPQPTDGATT